MNRRYTETPTLRKLLQSIWYQVNSGQEIYVIGEILEDRTVKGGTGWGAEFAKLCNKPLYVFDQKQSCWFNWKQTDWEKNPKQSSNHKPFPFQRFRHKISGRQRTERDFRAFSSFIQLTEIKISMSFECIRFETGEGIARIFQPSGAAECLQPADAQGTENGTRSMRGRSSNPGDFNHWNRTRFLCRTGFDGTKKRKWRASPRSGKSLEENYHPLIRRLRTMGKPIVCAVNGVAAGTGASFVLACDLVIAAKSASFIQAFSRIGLTPDCGSSYFLPRLVGEAKARALALTGDQIDAETAERWGMIWQCVPDEELQTQSESVALKLSRKAPLASRKPKNCSAIPGRNLEEQLQLEGQTQQKMGMTEDYREGVQAFLEKRQPRFQGK